MTTLREAAQQALEALEEYQSKGAPFLACDGAVDALRAALAQQAEPVAGRAFLERILAAMEGVIDVADRKTDEFDALRSCVIDLTVMLHAAPPQRKPLTEEEIEACRQQGYAHAGFSAPFDFGKAARAVERAHGIKE